MTRDPDPSAAMVLMRQRLTALRALWVSECGCGANTARAKSAAVKTREQLVDAILSAREARHGGEEG